jgi:ABC-type amino acid transport substrate-binding protein
MLAKERLGKASLKPVAHYEDALLALLAGEADALVADLTICELLVIRDVNGSLASLNKPLATEEIGIAINQNEGQLKNQLEGYLHQLASEGELKNFHSKWFANPGWLDLLP